MRYAQLELNNSPLPEMILVLAPKEVRGLIDAVEAAVAAHPRKSSYRSLLKALQDMPGYGF